MEAAIISAIASLLSLLGPEIVKALTGGQTPEEAIKAAHDVAAKIPVRENNGEWDRDLERRKRGEP